MIVCTPVGVRSSFLSHFFLRLLPPLLFLFSSLVNYRVAVTYFRFWAFSSFSFASKLSCSSRSRLPCFRQSLPQQLSMVSAEAEISAIRPTNHLAQLVLSRFVLRAPPVSLQPLILILPLPRIARLWGLHLLSLRSLALPSHPLQRFHPSA